MAELRAAVEADLPRIAALARWVWLDSYAGPGVSDSFARYVDAAFDPRTLRQALPGGMWVIEEGGFLLAWAQADAGAPCPVERDEALVELVRLYVAPPQCGQGHGKRLLDHVRAAHPRRSLWLTPWEGNAGALRFYRREGAELWGETWFELEGQRHRNEVLGWSPLQ
ncbi:GNAT family N-acetyltransferase [Roseateles violae]|uniref:GNAT family N-acetyltransferase n=1 Tax=Roseateles violae TaxID=3058042 RepID=A0ABT8DS73_9BURK|nr:GNAT family N-acetyltransferase [Pelomonas sp. PFR6]MDN3920918.1 GNAT family N-acetyltransferase [Pelomonas sp. PFR6]